MCSADRQAEKAEDSGETYVTLLFLRPGRRKTYTRQRDVEWRGGGGVFSLCEEMFRIHFILPLIGLAQSLHRVYFAFPSVYSFKINCLFYACIAQIPTSIKD